MSSTITCARPGSIGADLQRRRLEHRARRIEQALVALHRLANGRAQDGKVPPSLGQAIRGFMEELAHTERLLATL